MQKTKTKFKLGAAILCAGIAASPVAHAVSVIDLPDQAGNTIQANAGGDVFKPQIALWPIPNQSTIYFESNDATNRGDQTTGKPWILGVGAGNIIQLSTGGNVFNPQGAVFTDNNSDIQTYGNWAVNDGSQSQSVTGGQVLGHVVDGNGNVFQLEFLQGNVINPQVALFGDNNANIATAGNYADGNGNESSTASAGALAFVDGNGNVVQLVILSHNVINPQVSVGGSNSLIIFAKGNEASGDGNDSSVSATGFQGIFAVTQSTTGSGNVTQIAILSNNVWAPQLVLPDLNGNGGTNTGKIVTDTNDAEENGNGSDTELNPVPRPTPVIDAVRSVVAPLTGGKTPVLDAVQNAVQSTNGAQIGSGNINQQAPVGNGNIDNPQVNLANHKTPDVVNSDSDSPKPVAATTKKHPTPVKDAIKKTVSNIKTGLDKLKPKPKPKPASNTTP